MKIHQIRLHNQGFAALLIIFILGMVSLLVASGLLITGYNESVMARTGASGTSAYYEANSGIEEALYKINHIPNYGVGSPATFAITMASGSAWVTVAGSANERTIDSVGTSGNYVKKIHSEVSFTSLLPGFSYALHAGDDGLEIDNGSTINGNVYSNADIEGGSANDKCNGNPAMINGYATASGNLISLNDAGNGVCVSQKTFAHSFDACYIQKDAFGVPATAGCTVKGVYTGSQPTPPKVNLPDMQLSSFQNYLNSKGTTFSGDCTIGGSPDCSNGTGTIGTMIITGNLSLNRTTVKFSGPVWVKGNLSFDKANMQVGLTSDITSLSQIVIVDGKITVNANTTFIPNSAPSPSTDKAYLLFGSTYDPGAIPDSCTDKSIDIQANVTSVLFYAMKGCISLSGPSGSTTYYGSAVGKKIFIKNSSLTYDPDLGKAVFGLTKSGGWQTMSFSQK